MSASTSPPRLAQWLLERCTPAAIAEPLAGDLHEEFVRRSRAASPAAARRWYWREAVVACVTCRAASPSHSPDRHTGDSMITLLRTDVAFAWRQLWRRPAFTALVIGTLSLGTGAATAIFSAVYPILFAPLPYPHAGQLVMVTERGRDGKPGGIGYATIQDIRDMNHSLSGIAGITGWGPTLTGRAEPELLTGENVSANFFSVLGVKPALGRDFLPAEDIRGSARVAILGNALWRQRFGADSTLVGRTITLNDTPFTVVGIMPADFENVVGRGVQLWTTLRYNTTLPFACRTCHHVRAIARLKPGVTHAAALSDLNAISARLVADHPKEYAAPGMLATDLATMMTANVRPALLAVAGAVLLLLLIACTNVTSLLLARAGERQGEFSVRLALGAGRATIVRQLLTESMLLAMLAAGLGVAIAFGAVRALVAIAPANLPRINAVAVSVPALGFALLVACVTGVLFGLAPARTAAQLDMHQQLKQGNRRAAGTRRATRGVLVIAEIALALILLVGSGLLFRTMTRLLALSPGFNPEQLLTMQVQATGARFNDNAVLHQYFADVEKAVRAIPGVKAAAFTSQLPLSGDYDAYGLHLEAHPNAQPENDPSPFRYAVSAGYLETMQIPLRRGRLLTEADDSTHPAVALVNESFARTLWPGHDALGLRFRLGASDTGPWFTIVGIVGDVRHLSLAAEMPKAVYLPEVQWQNADGLRTLVIRSSVPPEQLATMARRAIWSVDRNQPIVRIATMNSLAASTEAQRHFTLILFGAFAAVALLLAAAGIYGLLAGMVHERLPELGVRSALGASRGSLVWLVVRHGALLTAVGVAGGTVAALALSRLMTSLIVGISPVDFVTYGAVALVLLVVAAIASWLPAWRASRVDPADALRSD